MRESSSILSVLIRKSSEDYFTQNRSTWPSMCYDMFMYREVDVVRANIPLLIGHDFLDDFRMLVNSVEEVIDCVAGNWTAHLTRQ